MERPVPRPGRKVTVAEGEGRVEGGEAQAGGGRLATGLTWAGCTQLRHGHGTGG